MPRRIEIELTSSRDGEWTWRAVGAKEPRGIIPGTLVPSGAKVGDALRVDAEFSVDGIEITGVLPTKGARQEPERLELLVSATDEPLVTTTLATRSRDDRGPRREGGRRDGAPRGPRREGEGRPDRAGGERRDRPSGTDRAARSAGDRPDSSTGAPARAERSDRPERKDRRDRPPRRTRPEPPPVPVVERPKARRLRPGKVHRTALLEGLPEEQRPIAEQVVLGGLPAVRLAIEKQNAERTAAGEPPIAAGPLLELAEKLVPKVRSAEWRDRAEAAQRDLEVLDLRDLRSVVSAADAGAKDEEARALAKELRAGLVARADAEHAAWLEELTATVEVGRIVRALRLSSRPPKAGAPLPAELATKLTEGAGAALTDDAPAERWVAVLDALAFAPVRDKVIPTSLPREVHEDVRSTIARLATRIPKIAHIFEIKPDRNAPRPKIERRRPKKAAPAKKAATPRPPKDDAKVDQPAAGASNVVDAAAPTTAAPIESSAPPSEATPAVAPAEPVAAEPAPVEPTPAEASAEPEAVEPAPAGPSPTEPTPTEPVEVEPTRAEAAPAEPEAVEPAPAEPAAAGPAPAEPMAAEPAPAEPAPAEPVAAEPVAAEPVPEAADEPEAKRPEAP